MLMAVAAAVGVTVSVATYLAIPPIFGARDEPVTISCAMSPSDPQEGQQVAMTYTVKAERAMTVGLSVQLYDDQGHKHANGTGAVDGVVLEQTLSQSSSRQPWSKEVPQTLVVPDTLAPGSFQVVAEAWPAGRVGVEDTTTLTSALCGYVTAPDPTG